MSQTITSNNFTQGISLDDFDNSVASENAGQSTITTIGQKNPDVKVEDNSTGTSTNQNAYSNNTSGGSSTQDSKVEQKQEDKQEDKQEVAQATKQDDTSSNTTKKEPEEVGAKDDTPAESFVETIFKNFGIDVLTDERGLPKSYLNENGEEDLNSALTAIQDLVPHLVQETIKDVHNKNPKYKQLLEFTLNGGDPTTLLNKQKLDYRQIQVISEGDEAKQQQAWLIAQNLIECNVDTKMAEETAQLYIKSGKGKELADSALAQMQKRQADEITFTMQQQEQKAIQERQVQEQYWTGVYSKVVKDGAIGEYKLPNDTKLREQAFAALIPRYWDENAGKYVSEVERKYNALPEETKLLEALRIAFDFDMSKMIKTASRKRESDTLQKLLNKDKKQVAGQTASTKTQNSTQRPVSIDDLITMEELERKQQNR